MTEDEVRQTPEYFGALLRLHMLATENDAPVFEQIDCVLCEDGKSFMLYGYRPDGSRHVASFEPEGE